MSRISSNHSKRLLDRFRPRSKRQRLQRARRRLFLHRPGMEGLEPRLMLASDLLVADLATDSILRFDGDTGAPLGAFVTSGSGGLVDPLDPTFGPDGNLYVISTAPGQVKVLRYNGTSGAPLGTFVNIGAGTASDIEFGPDGNLYLATISETGVLRFNGTTGAAAGVAASGNGIRRASGIDFGPDGLLYVLDSDRVIDTSADRVLRFDPASGAFIDQFVSPGFLNDAVFLTFGPDNQLYVPDIQQFHDVRRFSGETGAFLGVFATSPDPTNNFIFDIQFGPDGNAYAATGAGILRFDVESGALLGEFVSRVGGSFTFFPTVGPATDLAVTDVQVPVGVVQGNDLSITYTVINNSAAATAASSWDDVVYLSTDGVFDPSDREFGRITRTTGLSGGASYNETLTAPSPSIAFGDYHVFVLADRRGVVNDTARINNLRHSSSTLEVFPPLASSHDPDHSIAVGRTLSAYTTQNITNGELTLTYTVYNLTDGYTRGTLLETMLGEDVAFVRASQIPDQNGQELAWSLGVIPPYGRTSVELVVELGASNPLSPDAGLHAFGMIDTVTVQDSLPPVFLRTDAIDPTLLASTPDANSLDPFIQEQAATLDYDPSRIFEFLAQDIGYESYNGSLRGARGTLWSSAGNSLDEASLGIALLRSSGIPSKYAQGTLPDSLAQQLIGSMFPDNLQTVGYVPTGTQTSDPINDPQLLAETKQHYWIQFDTGAGFVNIDTSFSEVRLGESLTTTSHTFPNIPDELRHKVEVQLDAELYSQAAALFGLSDGLTTTTVLSESFNSVDLVGRPVTFGNFVSESSLGTPLFASRTVTYTPYLAVGDEALVAADQAEALTGTSFQEVYTNFPLGGQVLTGLFLKMTLDAPGFSSRSYDRALFDRIGYAARSGFSVQNISISPSSDTALNELSVWTVSVQPGLGNPNTSAAQLADFVGERSVLDGIIPGIPLTNAQQQILRQHPLSVTRQIASSYTLPSDAMAKRLALVTGVRAYADSPRLILVSQVVRTDGEGSTIGISIDLRRDELRVIANPGQDLTATQTFNVNRGLIETAIEALIVQQASPNQVVENTSTILAAATAHGIPILQLTSENLSVLQDLEFTLDAKARISAAVQDGKTIIVPAAQVPFGASTAIAWYQLDANSGELIGVTENGEHGSIVEFVKTLTVTQAVQVGFILTIAVNNPIVELLNGYRRRNDLIKFKKDLIGLITGSAGIFSVANDVAFGGVLLGFEAGIVFALALLTFSDPDASQSLAAVLPPLEPDNSKIGDKYYESTATAGSVDGQLSTSTLKISGKLEVTEKPIGISSFEAQMVSSANAVVINSNGQSVGGGTITIDTDKVQISVTGGEKFSVAGIGTLSTYASADSELAKAAEWRGFTADLSGQLELELTTDALKLNGILLPPDRYTINANSVALTGSGATSSFSRSLEVFAQEASVEIGSSTDDLRVNNIAFDADSGLTLIDFSGTVAISASGSAEFSEFSGVAGQILSVEALPASLTIDQNTSSTFEISLRTNLSDRYQISVEAPTGWSVDFRQEGVATVLPRPGLQDGVYSVRIVAQSTTNPELVSNSTVDVTVTSTTPEIALAVEPDPQFTVPLGKAQIPTAFRASLRNLGPTADKFTLAAENVPPGFQIVTSVDSLLVPAGGTGITGVYLVPDEGTPLPEQGTLLSFDFSVTSTTSSTITQMETVTFTMPEVHLIEVTTSPSKLSSIPGQSVESSIRVTNLGNVESTVSFSSKTSQGLTLTAPHQVSLRAGESATQSIELTPDQDISLNTTLLATLSATYGPMDSQQERTLHIPVRIATPGADAISSAAVALNQLGSTDLANRLNDLSIALTNLVQDPNNTVHKSQAASALDTVIGLMQVDINLAGFVPALIGPQAALVAAQSASEIQAAVVALGAALDGFGAAVTALAKSNFELFLLPNTQVALPQSPAQFELRIHNIGTATSKYNVMLQGVPAGVSATLSESQVTLARDEFATVMVTLTQTSLDELLEFGFSVDVSVDGAPQISKSAMGTLTARKEFISVVSMTATPPFTDAGGQIEVAARLLNAVNREQKARASFVVRDASGTQVRGASTPVDVTLTVQTSLVTLPLGSIDTTGLANGNYSIVLTLVDLDGNSIPGGAGSTNFLVGSPLTATIDVTPGVLPPGTNTITNTLKIEALAPLVSPPTLLGQVAAAGANDVVRNGDFVYVASPTGIQVFDIAGANLQNPQLLRTVGSATSLLEMRGNLLVSVLARPGGGSTTLTTFSLTDPATPTQLGTTGDIPYGTAADLIVTDTHAFVVLVNIIFTLNRDIFDQNGGLIAINISNPAAPFFDGDAVTAKGTPAGRDGVNDGVLFNENGTNNDGIKNPIGIDQSGGNQNTWSIVQVSPAVLLLSGSTATGTDTQIGVGVVRVVDISDPRNMRLLRDLQVPGTVHVFDVAVSGNRGLLTASQGGFADFTQGFPFTGNVVLATLDLSDPANPQIIHQQTLDRSARSVDHATALGSGMFAIANLGGVSDQPGLFIVDASAPNQFGLAGLDVPAGINELVGGNGLIFTTDGASLIVYDVPSKDPLTLIGQVSIPGGLRGVAARNNIAYASGANGIQVIDYADPQNPVVVGTIPGNHYGAVIQDNVLLALRPAGPSFILDVFALQNTPLAPPLIGSSPVINYNLAAELRSNSTHAFIGQFNVCYFLGSNDIYHQAGDMISLALNLDDPLNPSVATPTLDNVLFNTNGDNQFDPTDVSGCAENGGDHNVFGIALANPQTAYLATTTVTGGDTQAGIGHIQVVDVTVPATAQVIRELDIPGTVVTLGVGVSSNVGVVIGSTQGFQDNPNGVIIGNLTVTTLDVSDPRDPKIVTTRTLDRITSTFWVNFTTLGNGRFAFSNAAFTGNVVDPAVIIIDASNPRSPLIGQSDIPLDLIAPNSLSTDGNFLFTADAAGSLSLYRVNPLPGLPVTARVRIPNGTGVTVVPGSFNIPPADVIAGTDFDTYVFDLTLAPSLPSEMLVWQSVVNGLRPGESRPVTLGTTIDFAFQGTAGQVVLPRTAVAAEQIMSLFPSERSVRPGEEAPFSVLIVNPSTLDVTYDLSVSGLPAEWVSLDPSITVPAGGSAVAFIRLTSGAFDVLGDYGFVVNATVAGVNSSVAGTLTLTGTPMLPDVHPDARGVVVSLSPATATVGQGTSATYVARVFNVGSLPDDFVLFVTGLPAGFQTNFNAGIINVPPGSSNFRDVQLTVTAPLGTSAADYPFTVVAASITDVTITGETQGVVSVVPLGVQVDITPAISGPNSTVQMLVTNTGQATETYDLSLAAPVALVATLGSASVTLQPGESMSIPISIGAIDFAFPGSLMLAGVARSRTNSDVFASDSVDVTILSTSGLTAGFDRPMQQLAAPGAATFLLQVDNLGNLEDEFTATILSTNGPINASLVGLRGETTQTVPIFRLPGLSTGALVLNTNLMSNGAASVIVRVASRTNPQLFSDATATLQSELATTLSIAAANADKLEGDADFTPFNFTVTRGGNLSGATTVNWTTVGSGASPADAGDFGGSFPSGQVSFAPTETTKTLTINVSGDRFIEPDETFSVVLSGASEDATIIASSANGTIRNDDALPAVLRIEATSADKLEGNSGSTVFTFTVTRSGNLSGVTTVDYAVTGAGLIPADAVDFGGSLPSGQLNFAINESSKTISVVVRGDTINELDEKFIVTLSNASGPAIIDVATAAGVIRNDDVESGFRLTCSSLRVGLNTCTVLGATPGGIVNLALGIVPGTKFLPKFGVTLGIQDSSIVAQGIVQPDGRAVVQFTIANEQILQQVLLQAFEQAPTPRTTNIVIVGMPLRAAAGQLGGNEAISNQVLPSLLAAAVARWQATGLSYRESQLLESLTVEIVDLPTGMLGQAVDQRIFVDSTAAGHGWFVDTTPADNAEFAMTGHPAVRNASAAGPAQGRVDLLTVLMHEIGHVLGLGDSANSATSPLMSPTLTDGVRRLPTADAVTRDPLDINRDGLISPLDVLLIINQINLSAVGNAKAESLAFPSEYDINQDGILSALDPLLVINYLNHRAAYSQSGEGESEPRDELFSVPNLFELSATENSTDDELLQALAADAVNTWLNDRRGALFSLR